MKRIIFLLGMIALFTIGVEAQDATVSRNGTNFNIALTAADTLSDNSTTLSKVIGVGNKQAVQLYSVMVTLDSISGTPTETILLQGSMDNVTYVDIDTISWIGTSSDTTFYYTDLSTGVAWPYVRVLSTESGTAKAQLTNLRGRFIDKVR